MVALKFENTPVRTIAGMVSLAGLVGLCWLCVPAFLSGKTVQHLYRRSKDTNRNVRCPPGSGSCE